MPARVPFQSRKKLASEIPWVTLLKRERPCDGTVYTNGRWNNDRFCRKSARWKFRYLKKTTHDGPKVQYFCWSHLIARGLYHSQPEIKRTERWLEKNRSKVDAILGKTED